MNRNAVGAAVIAVVAVAVAGGVILARQSEPSAGVAAPGVRVETDAASGDATVKAPYTDVEKTDEGVRVQAPGVDVQIPKRSTE